MTTVLSQPFRNDMGHAGFTDQELSNLGNLSNYAPNHPYLYGTTVALLAAAGSRGTFQIKTEVVGKAFMCSQILAVVHDATPAELTLSRIFIEISTGDRRWQNQAVPLTLFCASASNPNGPRLFRDYIKPGDTISGTLLNYTGVAATVYLGFAGHRYQR